MSTHPHPPAPALSRTKLLSLIFALTPLAAQAVVVRGTVTDQLGAPVPGARVQLIQGRQTASYALSGSDGSFEIRSGDSGRFLLLTSAGTFAPNIGTDFYGGKTDIVLQTVILSPAEIRTEVSVTESGTPTPLPQLTAPVTLIPRDDLLTRIGLVEDLRQSPGTFVVQTGQTGSVTSLFVRGGNSDANKVLIDGIPAEDVGGTFDFGTVSSTGLAGPPRDTSAGNAIELYRGPNSALYGSDSLASVVNLSTPRGASLKPVLNYSGDAGNLHTWRNEAILSGTHRRADYLLAYSRFDTSNALPHDRFHSSTAAANLGYNITAATELRFTLRNADSANGLPNAYNFYHLVQDGKQSDQDLYSGVTLENTTLAGWHNLVRYGIARKREQAAYFGNQGTLTPIFGYPTYLGNTVLIRAANGYTATGRAQLFSSNRDQSSLRDELYYQSDITFLHHYTALFGFRYENERGSFNIPAYSESEQIQRTNFQFNLQLGGDLKNRLFYSFGGSLQKNHLYGIAGTPRLGLAYILVRPDQHRYLHGTRLRANAATGVQEPSLATEFSSLHSELLALGDTADIARYNVSPLGPTRSRTFDLGLDQNLIGQKLILKAGYFHNQFSHQLEYVSSGDLKTYFGFTPATSAAAYFYGAELNSQAFRAQGLETELQYQPLNRLFVRAGYTYLDTRVSQSFTGSVTAVAKGRPTTNPNLPGIPIGSSSPLLGARPFRRPPHTGFFAVQYTGQRWTAALKGALSSRSDDSTFLGGSDQNDGNSLLLPNRDLDPHFAKLDAYGTYNATHHITVFTDLSNLLNDQHIGPIGYPSLPLTIRAGLKLRLGGD
jgi:vitamin B12 transporter